MKLKDYPQYIIKMSQKQAAKLDLLWCHCGHRINNHFDHGLKPCAHCPCTEYEEFIRLPKDD